MQFYEVLVSVLMTMTSREYDGIDNYILSFNIKRKYKVLHLRILMLNFFFRAHRNDLENIPMFLFAGFIYILTNPNAWLAVNLFRTYTFFRIVHTYVYAIHVIPQPARALTWGISYLINWYMVIVSAATFCTL